MEKKKSDELTFSKQNMQLDSQERKINFAPYKKYLCIYV